MNDLLSSLSPPVTAVTFDGFLEKELVDPLADDPSCSEEWRQECELRQLALWGNTMSKPHWDQLWSAIEKHRGQSAALELRKNLAKLF